MNLESVLSIWGDVVRDVDQVGLTLTRMSAEKEMEIGHGIAAKIASRRSLGGGERYIAEVGQRMMPYLQRDGIRYQFHVLESPDVNAHAIPGGHVYVTTGMLDFVENEAELAAVIGHEIAHVDLRHCIERLQYEQAARKVVGEDLAWLAHLGYELLRLGFSEEQELEADANGLLLAAKAGYDPGAAMTFFSRMAERSQGVWGDKPGTMTGEAGKAVIGALRQYFETHPYGEVRVRQLMSLYRKNASRWEGKRFYLGRSNLRDGQSRSISERDEEWVEFRLPIVLPKASVEKPAEALDPDPKLAKLTDKVICTGMINRDPDYIREAERRGFTEARCRELTGLTIDTAGVPAEQIEALDETRTARDTWVRMAPRDDAAALGYVNGTVRVTGWVREAGWYRIVWSGTLTGYVRAEALDPIPKFASYSDRDVCNVMIYGFSDHVREAQRRGLSEDDCRALIDGASEAAAASVDHIEPLEEMRSVQRTTVRTAPRDDAPVLGYAAGEVRVTGWVRETGWYWITWGESQSGFVRAEALDPIPKFASYSDRDICNVMSVIVYGIPDHVREAQRRGLSEDDCRALLDGASETVVASVDHIESLEEKRSVQSTTVRTAPRDDAPMLGYAGGEVRVTGWVRETGWYRITWSESQSGFVRAQALNPLPKFLNFTDREICYVRIFGNPDYLREAQRRELTDEQCHALVGGSSPTKDAVAFTRRADGQWKGRMTCGSCPDCPGPLEKEVGITIDSGSFELVPDASYTGKGKVAEDNSVKVWWQLYGGQSYAARGDQNFHFEGRFLGDRIELVGERGPRKCQISFVRIADS